MILFVAIDGLWLPAPARRRWPSMRAANEPHLGDLYLSAHKAMTPMILLVDNGSSRPAAVQNLRAIAARTAARVGMEIHAVPLLHAEKIPAQLLDGAPAEIFETFLMKRAAEGQHEFLLVPLFFGPSRALSDFVPQVIARTEAAVGALQVQTADILCPLPDGEPGLVDIMEAHARTLIGRHGLSRPRILVVDHGSPQPAVTAVRNWLATQLGRRFGPEISIGEAVMERRAGPAYDFNGKLLAEALDAIAAEEPTSDVVVIMQFISPGRHAGPDGDIAEIIRDATDRNPGMRVYCSPLLSEHETLPAILEERIASALRSAPPMAGIAGALAK
jgi:sirohydrochlorin ferrochelatase